MDEEKVERIVRKSLIAWAAVVLVLLALEFSNTTGRSFLMPLWVAVFLGSAVGGLALLMLGDLGGGVRP